MIVLLMDFMIVRCPYNPSYLDTPCPVALVDDMELEYSPSVVVVASISRRNHEK